MAILRVLEKSRGIDAAISLLDAAGPQHSGDMLETGSATMGTEGG